MKKINVYNKVINKMLSNYVSLDLVDHEIEKKIVKKIEENKKRVKEIKNLNPIDLI